MTVAGPGVSGTVWRVGVFLVSVLAAAGFEEVVLASVLGLVFFFFLALAALGLAGAFVVADKAGAAFVSAVAVGAGGMDIGAVGGVLVTCCAITLAVTAAIRTSQIDFFINQVSRDFISASVNVRHLPGFSSANLILPICTRTSLVTVRACESKRRRTSRYLPSASTNSTTL